MSSILEQYRIADFVQWHQEKTIVLNPDFQRGRVWSAAARSYLIDSILQQLPIPKIYMRTKIDLKTKRPIREVVDGQQRLRAILDFADDKLKLSKRAEEYVGNTYSTLKPELQEIFLQYPLSVDQLINASNDDVLEVFARLNSYTVILNPPEKRHATYEGEFKWAVRRASRRWHILWDEYHVVSTGRRVRMYDDSLMAELFGVLIRGVTDGGQSQTDKLYRDVDKGFDPKGQYVYRLDSVLEKITTEFADYLKGTPILKEAHFLMLFAAIAHALFGIPEGGIGDKMPSRDPRALSDLNLAKDNLLTLASVIEAENVTPSYEDFRNASQAQTVRISSRKIRFPYFYLALLPEPL